MFSVPFQPQSFLHGKISTVINQHIIINHAILDQHLYGHCLDYANLKTLQMGVFYARHYEMYNKQQSICFCHVAQLSYSRHSVASRVNDRQFLSGWAIPAVHDMSRKTSYLYLFATPLPQQLAARGRHHQKTDCPVPFAAPLRMHHQRPT